MGQIDQAFLPPRYWQQFEELTLGCFREFLGDQTAERHGRSGFPQAGVDVYGRAKDGFTGVQCKQTDPLDPNGEILAGGRITKGMLLSEIDNAEQFAPKLDVFILATTVPIHPPLQKAARLISEDREARGKFRVRLWFWDDYRAFLNASHRLQGWFYRDVLQILSRADEDREMLQFYAEAFHRPAFQTPLSAEDFGAFDQAIEDTQTALRTGQLFDRRSRTKLSQSLGWRRLSDPHWRRGLQRVDDTLHQLRLKLLEGQQKGVIRQNGRFMEIDDPQVRAALDDLRRACVDDLNNVLRQASLPTL